ncbi:cell division control protein 6 homolog [Ambystoma mexicanum]|uniref:cell division control protein 6 homolog n=1 Tax=Ambystoma mexicanum TaxID=8296 RepID=UPI0037E9790D
MPRTRLRGTVMSQSSIDFPKRKTGRTQIKSLQPKERTCEVIKVLPTPLSPQSKLLPLSPRKRLGDDNLCNIQNTTQCSPPKQSKKENCMQNTPSPKGRRLLFAVNEVAAGNLSPAKSGQNENLPSPLRRGQETPSSSKQPFRPSGSSVCTKLFKQDSTCYQQAKQAFSTAVPDRMLAREGETAAIRQFLKEHISGTKPGSLYISGAPGTGKTACFRRILQDSKNELAGCRTIFINCMSLRSSQGVFHVIADGLAEDGKEALAGKDITRKLEKQLTAEGPMVLLVLDEMDQLDSKGQDVLYTVFEWPWLSHSRMVLVGIANALDFTDRILPRLQARPKCKPQLLNFPPYTKDQIATILQERLKQVSGEQVLDNAAIQFCARKVSAVSGDARKALDVCRRAVEIVESDVRSQTLLKPLSECKSPTKASPVSLVPKRVSLPHISRVISDVYGDRMTSSNSGGADDSFPLQQKLLVCTLLMMTRQSKVKEVTLGKLHEAYSKVCRKQQVPAVGQSECLSLSSLLESRGILGLKKSKEARLTKICLKIEERDVEHSLKDKALVGNILHGGLA